MKRLKDFEDYPVHMMICIVCVIALLLMGSFSIWSPPRGDIANNVLKYCWILVFTIAIFQVRPIIHEAKTFRFTRGNTSIEVEGKDPIPKQG